jgi:hypothetical protein
LCGQLEATDPGVAVSLTTALQRLPPITEHAFPEQPEAIEISRVQLQSASIEI